MFSVALINQCNVQCVTKIFESFEKMWIYDMSTGVRCRFYIAIFRVVVVQHNACLVKSYVQFCYNQTIKNVLLNKSTSLFWVVMVQNNYSLVNDYVSEKLLFYNQIIKKVLLIKENVRLVNDYLFEIFLLLIIEAMKYYVFT